MAVRACFVLVYGPRHKRQTVENVKVRVKLLLTETKTNGVFWRSLSTSECSLTKFKQ